MQSKCVVLVFRGGLIGTGQVVSVENHGYGFVHGIQLVQEVDCCLIGDAHALCIGIDLSAFVIVQVFCDICLVKLVVEIPVVIGHVILHGDELQELRVFLRVQLIDDVLVGSRIIDVRRIVGSVLMRDRWLAVQRVELVEPELLVVHVTQIHVLVIRVECHGTGFAVFGIPDLIPREWVLLMRDELLVHGLHRVVKQGKIQSGERLVLDVRGASAKTRGEHQTGGGCFFQGADVGHWVFGQGDAGHACWVGEALRKNHDDGVIGEVISTRSINLVCLGAVFLGQLFHRFLAVPLGLIHDFRMRKAQEIDDGTVVCRVALGVP